MDSQRYIAAYNADNSSLMLSPLVSIGCQTSRCDQNKKKKEERKNRVIGAPTLNELIEASRRVTYRRSIIIRIVDVFYGANKRSVDHSCR